jgi:hypothetical protein
MKYTAMLETQCILHVVQFEDAILHIVQSIL